MKKLLSLLSVLTISGSAVPTTIAANPYQKEEINNKINYSKTNNSENLIRIKRQTNQQKSKEILQLTEKLIININNRTQYITSFNNIINELVTNNILRPYLNLNSLIRPEFHSNQGNILYTLNTENYGYFRIPIEIRGIDEQNQQSYQRNLELVLRTDNLYLQGFIINNNYYHFNFNNVNQNMQPQSVRDGSVPLLTQIEGMENIQLENISPDYPNNMIPSNGNEITWQSIFDSFWRLTDNNIDIYENPLGKLAISLGQVIFVTAEALRFWSIYTEIRRLLIINNEYIELNTNPSNNYYGLLTSWSDESRIINLAIEQINNPNFGPIDLERYLNRNTRQYVRELFSTIVNQPLNAITNMLVNTNIRILLGTFILRNLNCNKPRVNLNDNYWKEEICDLEPKIKKIQGEINVFKILDKNKGDNLKAEDIFIGTTEGLYFIRKNGIVLKVDNIDGDENEHTEITSIKEFGNGNFYVSTNDKKVYFLNTKFVNDGHIIGEIQSNIKSSNLEKELKIYIKTDHKDEEVGFNYNQKNYNYFSRDLYIGRIDPSKYEKIEFLGNNFDITKIAWGNTDYYSDFKINYYSYRNFDDIVKNRKVENNYDIERYADNFIQYLDKDIFLAVLRGQQYFGVTWYKEFKDYYIQFLVKQYAEKWSGTDGSVVMGIGNSIKLYNNDNYDNNKFNNARENKNIDFQLLIQYLKELLSEVTINFEYYWSKFKDYLNYYTIENIYFI